MAGFKFWEWETDEERRDREAQDFVRRAEQEKRDVNADRFLNDAKNWLGDRTQDVGSAIGNAAGTLGTAAHGALQGTQESYFNLARKVLPEEPAREVGRFAGVAEPMMDPSGLATGTLERLGVPGGQETGMKADLLDVGLKAAPGLGALKNVAEKVTGQPIKSGVELEFGPRELAAAPLMTVSPVGKVVKGIEGATRVGGRFAKELAGVKTGFDLLDKTPLTTAPFPDEGIKHFVDDIKTIFDERGGATYGIHTGDKLNSPEFAIGVFPGRSRIIEGHAGADDIKSFIEDNKLPLKDPRVNVGLWENEGKTYMDLSLTVPEQEQAEAIARHFNQLAYYDLKQNKEIFVGKTAEGANELRFTKIGDHHYVSDLGEQKMHIGEGGLVRADDTEGLTHSDLMDMGYKGVYYPVEDKIRLFDDKIEAPKATENKPSILGGVARIFGNEQKQIIPVEEAAKLQTPTQKQREHIATEYGEDLANLFDASKWGRWTDQGLAIDLKRYQKEELPGKEAPRGGVFYSPKESNIDYNAPAGEEFQTGGPQRLEGTTLFKNPMFIKTEDTGGMVNDAAQALLSNDQLFDLQRHASNFTSGDDASTWERLISDFHVKREDLQKIADNVPGGEKAWAIKELVVSQIAREKGIDGLIGVQAIPRTPHPAYWDLNNYTYTNAAQNSPHYSEVMKNAYAIEANNIAEKFKAEHGIDLQSMSPEEFEQYVKSLKGKENLKPFEVFDIRENVYPGPDGSWSVFDMFKPIGNALQQVPASQVRSALEGGVAGGIEGFQQDDGGDPFVKTLNTIEGAAFGASTRAAARNSLTQLRMAGANENIIKSFNYKLVQGPKIERGDAGILKLMYNSMLSGPMTMAGQFLSLGPEIGARVIRDLGSDLIHGHPENIGGTFQGLLEGMRAGSYGLADGLSNLLAEGAFEIPTRMIEAIDTWNRAILYGMAVGYHAGAKADKMGMTAAAKGQYVKDALFDPVKAGVHEQAFADAMRGAYMKGEDRISTLMNMGQGINKKVAAGETGKTGEVIARATNELPYLKAIFPFVSTVHRMGTRALEFSPVGLAGTGFDVARGVYDTGRSTWGKNAIGDIQNVTPLGERLGNNVIGTALYVWFWDQARKGNITGYGPNDQSTRDAMIRQGWQPYSIKVGDTYYDYRRIGPLAQVLAMAAAPAEMERYKKTNGDMQDQFMYGVRTFVALGEEMTYLRGLTELIRGATSGNMEPYLESSARRLVPFGALLSSIATTMDPKMRDAGNWQDEISSMLPGKWDVGLPIKGREALPERMDVYANPRENPKAGIASIIPTRISKWEPTKIDSELQRLDLAAGRVDDKITDEFGIEHRLTDAEKRKYQQIAGDGKRAAFEVLMASDAYKNADDAGKKTMLSTVTRHAASWARETLYPGTVKDAELAKYNGDAVSAGQALVRAIEVKAKIGDLAAKKYPGRTAEEAQDIDDWKSSLAALRQQYGKSIGDQAFRNQYGMTAYVRANTQKPTRAFTQARTQLVKQNPEYNAFFGDALDPNEVESAKTLIPA